MKDKEIKKEFNGYSFEEKEQRKRMKYLVVTDGDLDINGAYAFKSKKDLKEYLKDWSIKKTEAIFEIKDITDNYER